MSDPISILERIVSGLAEKRPMALMLVVERTGSAPGGKGALMLLDTVAPALGTIGGGAVEYEALGLARTAVKDGKPRLLRFCLTPEISGMPCGGSVTVLIAPMGGTPGTQTPVFAEALERLRENAGVTLAVKCLPAPLAAVADLQILDGITLTIAPENSEAPSAPGTFFFRLEPAPRLFVFGGGHIAQALAPMALATGFRVTVLDDRADYLDARCFPEPVATTALPSFKDGLAALSIDASSWILIATYGHMHDRIVLEQALSTPAVYIGLVGSRNKRKHLFEALQKSGWGPNDIARVHTPVGLPIGAVTPAEIAVSILAEMIAVRRKKKETI